MKLSASIAVLSLMLCCCWRAALCEEGINVITTSDNDNAAVAHSSLPSPSVPSLSDDFSYPEGADGETEPIVEEEAQAPQVQSVEETEKSSDLLTPESIKGAIEEAIPWAKSKLTDLLNTLKTQTTGENIKCLGRTGVQNCKHFMNRAATTLRENAMPISGGLLWTSLLAAASYAKSAPLGVAAVFSPLLLLGAARLTLFLAVGAAVMLGLASAGMYAAAKMMLRFMSNAGGVLGKVARRLEPVLEYSIRYGKNLYVGTWGKEEETVDEKARSAQQQENFPEEETDFIGSPSQDTVTEEVPGESVRTPADSPPTYDDDDGVANMPTDDYAESEELADSEATDIE